MRYARAVLDALRLAFSRDTLGHESPPAAAAPARRGVLHVLLVSREPLGEEPAAPPRRSRLAALFAPEKLDDSP